MATAFMVVGVVTYGYDKDDSNSNREISETETEGEDTISSFKEATNYAYTFACLEDFWGLLQPTGNYITYNKTLTNNYLIIAKVLKKNNTLAKVDFIQHNSKKQNFVLDS